LWSTALLLLVIMTAHTAHAQTTVGIDPNGREANVSSNGRFVAYSTLTTGDLQLLDRQTGQRSTVANGHVPCVSDDGRYVAYFSTPDPKLYVKDMVTNASIRLNGDVDCYLSSYIDMTPDGRYVVFDGLRGGQTKQIFLCDRDLDADGIYDEDPPEPGADQHRCGWLGGKRALLVSGDLGRRVESGLL
jgi:hypothetical protein